MCPDNGLFGRPICGGLLRLAPFDVYHPRDSWLLFNPVIARGYPANQIVQCNSGLRSTRLAAHPHLKPPLHAFVNLHSSSRMRYANPAGVVAEFTSGLRLRASSYDLSGKIAFAYFGSATDGYEQELPSFMYVHILRNDYA